MVHLEAWSGCVNECLRSHVSGGGDGDGEENSEFLMLGAHKIPRICCNPTVGWLSAVIVVVAVVGVVVGVE